MASTQLFNSLVSLRLLFRNMDQSSTAPLYSPLRTISRQRHLPLPLRLPEVHPGSITAQLRCHV